MTIVLQQRDMARRERKLWVDNYNAKWDKPQTINQKGQN